ncbi:MAG TPA: hypothetical protein VGO11_07025 [Chthoniobacteraceae bacterium]|nr:hypothetical protein [Chthoniobacteraceae bacterium]
MTIPTIAQAPLNAQEQMMVGSWVMQVSNGLVPVATVYHYFPDRTLVVATSRAVEHGRWRLKEGRLVTEIPSGTKSFHVDATSEDRLTFTAEKSQGERIAARRYSSDPKASTESGLSFLAAQLRAEAAERKKRESASGAGSTSGAWEKAAAAIGMFRGIRGY